jgi:hypothetical protein
MYRRGIACRRFIVVLTACYALTAPIPVGLAQTGGGSAGSGAGGGSSLGGGGGSSSGSPGVGGGSPGMGRPVVPRGKNPDAPLLNPQIPNSQSQQRDRAQRLEEQLRHGQVNPTTPQTEMSDRLDQLYKNSPTGPSVPKEGGAR